MLRTNFKRPLIHIYHLLPSVLFTVSKTTCTLLSASWMASAAIMNRPAAADSGLPVPCFIRANGPTLRLYAADTAWCRRAVSNASPQTICFASWWNDFLSELIARGHKNICKFPYTHREDPGADVVGAHWLFQQSSFSVWPKVNMGQSEVKYIFVFVTTPHIW